MARDTAQLFAQATTAHQAGDLVTAVPLYDQLLALNPGHAQALDLSAVALFQLGRAAEALPRLREAVRLSPENPHFADHLGTVYAGLGQFDVALAAHDHALALAPDHLEAANNRANALRALGRLSEAVSAYRAVLNVAPGRRGARVSLAGCLMELGQFEAAEAEYRELLARFPDVLAFQEGAAIAALKAGAAARALSELVALCAAAPERADLHLARGRAAEGCDDWSMAEAAYRAALQLEETAAGWFNLGNAFDRQRRNDEAVAAYRNAIALAPNDPAFKTNFALNALATGNLAEGWPAYEHRFASDPDTCGLREFPVPAWDGRKLDGQSLVIWREQGIGDEIRFSALYADTLKAAGPAKVVFEADARLIPALQRSLPPEAIIRAAPALGTRAGAADADLHLPAGSQMRLFRPTIESFGDAKPFLKPDPVRQAVFRAWIATLGPGLACGLAWRSRKGREVSAGGARHYTELSDWADLIAEPGRIWINLQYDAPEDEIRALEKATSLTLNQPPGLDLFNDIDGQLALAAALDVVISPSIVTADIAGAVGTDALVLVYGTDWTLLGQRKNPWYPGRKTFFRGADGRWDEAIAAVRADLAGRGLAQPLKPDAELWGAVGNLLQAEGRYREAMAVYAQALTVAPTHTGLMVNRSRAAAEVRDFDSAMADAEKALAINPDLAEAHFNLANAKLLTGDTAAALYHFDEALALRPEWPEARKNRGMAQLFEGRLVDGFDAYDARLDSDPKAMGVVPLDLPLWDGRPKPGLHLLIRREQGVGDEVRFASCYGDAIRAVASMGGRVTIDCDPRFLPLFTRSFPSAHVIASGQGSNGADCQIHAGSLMRFYRTRLQDFPGKPYLVPAAARVASFRQRLAPLGPGPKIGIAWRSKLATGDRAKLYPALFDLIPVMKVPGASFINLQYDRAGEDIAALAQTGHPVPVFWDDIDLLNDFDAVVALIAALDLVITADTVIKDLAGAQAKPFWCLEYMSRLDWTRFGLERDPWYPVRRAFEPGEGQGWSDLGHQVAHALGPWVEGFACGARGALLLQKGEEVAAAAAFSAGLELASDAEMIRALTEPLALLLHKRGEAARAVPLLKAALRRAPHAQELTEVLGHAYAALGDMKEAVPLLTAAVARNPANLEAWIDLGNAAFFASDFAEAIRCFEAILEQAPAHDSARRNLARVLIYADRAAEAETRLTEISQTADGAVENARRRQLLSLAYLAQGKLAQGWEHYDARLTAQPAACGVRPLPMPNWDGADPANKTIFVWMDQGLGDQVLFATLLPDIIRAAGKVIIECEPRLAAPFARTFPSAMVVPRTDPIHPSVLAAKPDAAVAAGSLARLYRKSMADFPAKAIALAPEPKRAEHAQAFLRGLPPGMKVGIAWRSLMLTSERSGWYLPVEAIKPLLDIPDTQFICLQYGWQPEELDRLKAVTDRPLHIMPGLDLKDDLDGVLALCGALDLVISPSSTAGALAALAGAPVFQFAIRPSDVDALGTDHVPWLPLMRCFRRRWDENWDAVMAEMVAALKKLVSP